MASRTVTNLTAVLQMNNSKFKKGLTSSQKALKGFQNQVKAVGGMIAGAFAVGALVNFGREAVNVAMKAEGIRTAFARLNKPDLLDDLQKATRRTVSEVELMQASVRAENFKIPLEQLATFFQFATDRAIQTGESVQYLTQSIIDGIGRKSTLVLDNLGISASELQEEMKKVGDFGQAAANIIEREMKKAGNVMDTTAIQAAQLRARFEDLKEEAGHGLIEAFIGVANVLEMKFNPQMSAARSIARDINKELDEISKRTTIGPVSIEQLFALEKAKRGLSSPTPAKSTLPSVSRPSTFMEQFPLGHANISEDYQTTLNILEHKLKYIADTGLPNINEGLATTADLAENFDEWLNEITNDFEESLGDESFTKVDKMNTGVDKLGASVGVMLVGSFDSLGEAIGRSLAGAESGIQDLGKAILQNLGSILIMAGFQSGNIPMIVAGAALQLGSGIMRGLGSGTEAGYSSYTGGANNVNFTISGNNLVGVLERHNNKHDMIT